jgi:hypothetical protein
MIAAELWKVRHRGAWRRKARPRRAAVGELIRWDSSKHAWLEERYPGSLTLIKMIDDATNRILFARFVPRDIEADNRRAVIDSLRCHGRPVAFYTDKAGHLAQHTRPVSRIPREERDHKLTRSAHRRLTKTIDLDSLFAETLTPTVSNEFTIRYDHRKLQIPKRQVRGIRPGDKIPIELRLDGSTRFRWNKRYLNLVCTARLLQTPPCAAPAKRTRSKRPSASSAPPEGPRTPPTPPRPGPVHPWRQNGVLWTNARTAVAARRASARRNTSRDSRTTTGSCTVSSTGSPETNASRPTTRRAAPASSSTEPSPGRDPIAR